MNSRKLPCLPIIFLLSLPFLQFPVSWSNPDEYLYNNCGGSFSCGSITGIDYPFRGNEKPDYCGYPGFVLSCQDNTTTIDIKNVQYRVLHFNQEKKTMRIAREDVMEASCPRVLVDTTLDDALFGYASNYMNVTFLYGCQNVFNFNISTISCNASRYDNAYMAPGAIDPLTVRCQAGVTVPSAGITLSVNSTILQNAVREGFDVSWKVSDDSCNKCTESGGRCGYNSYSNQTTCYCPHEPYVGATCSAGNGGSSSAKPGNGSDSGMKIWLPIVGAIVAGIGLGWVIFSVKQRRMRKADMAAQSSIAAKSKDISSPPLTRPLNSASTNYSRTTPSYVSSRTEFGMASTYFGVQVFSYADLEEATNNFDPSMELGEGGFGTVYYGKLQDGRVVAVKRLYENNFKRVEQFMNEVEILTKLRHDNLVTLYGCTSKRSRELLLVYEYIPNGTVADHLHGKRSNSGLLSWPIRLNIAIETADALSYLHRSTIIHRDVKTNNILLDNDFRVKVADFGLSRLFPLDVTHVSTAPQGTPGYVDPEYYQCYQLTEKSDVYSFGVVLIELISSKMAVDTNRDRHDINLANMAINKIQNHALNELVDPALGFETNPSVRRMTTLVAELAFRCLQLERDMRPSMDEVVNALRGIKEGDSVNGEKADVVDIIVEDDSGPLKGHPPPMSPDSNVTDKNVSSSSAINSFG